MSKEISDCGEDPSAQSGIQLKPNDPFLGRVARSPRMFWTPFFEPGPDLWDERAAVSQSNSLTSTTRFLIQNLPSQRTPPPVVKGRTMIGQGFGSPVPQSVPPPKPMRSWSQFLTAPQEAPLPEDPFFVPSLQDEIGHSAPPVREIRIEARSSAEVSDRSQLLALAAEGRLKDPQVLTITDYQMVLPVGRVVSISAKRGCYHQGKSLTGEVLDFTQDYAGLIFVRVKVGDKVEERHALSVLMRNRLPQSEVSAAE